LPHKGHVLRTNEHGVNLHLNARNDIRQNPEGSEQNRPLQVQMYAGEGEEEGILIARQRPGVKDKLTWWKPSFRWWK
jgi:hypothetical protein